MYSLSLCTQSYGVHCVSTVSLPDRVWGRWCSHQWGRVCVSGCAAVYGRSYVASCSGPWAKIQIIRWSANFHNCIWALCIWCSKKCIIGQMSPMQRACLRSLTQFTHTCTHMYTHNHTQTMQRWTTPPTPTRAFPSPSSESCALGTDSQPSSVSYCL